VGRRVPAAERVLDYILAEMDAGRLGAGARVNAAQISATLGLSAAPVREALSVLAGRGVLDLLPDRGAVMRIFTVRDVVQLWAVMASIAATGLSAAAEAITAGADTALLVERFEAIRDRPLETTPVAFLLRLNEWHHAAHSICGNPFVQEMMDRSGVAYWDRYLAQLIDVHGHIDGYLANYRRMHEAVMAGDSRAASAVMYYHADWSISLINASAAAQPIRRRRLIRRA
jgi:DNA-binding GntR family transcriptional regulator